MARKITITVRAKDPFAARRKMRAAAVRAVRKTVIDAVRPVDDVVRRPDGES